MCDPLPLFNMQQVRFTKATLRARVNSKPQRKLYQDLEVVIARVPAAQVCLTMR